MNTDHLSVLIHAMAASGTRSVGELTDYCRANGTTPAELAASTVTGEGR